MQADKKGSYVSMCIIIFIVSIGVLNTILMGTLERTREFGVLKTIGTRPISVFYLIMLEYFVLAIIACLIGRGIALKTA
ncbi:MAG: FtsX-like permease family protein [Alteromonadales bacterium]|nr:FtsX-like permease family protein [Alteromonadales bacterium]